MLECQKVPRLPRETKLREAGNFKNVPFCRTYQRHSHSDLAQTVADGCERLRTIAQRLANTAQPPHPQSETGTLATHSGKTLIAVMWDIAKFEKGLKFPNRPRLLWHGCVFRQWLVFFVQDFLHLRRCKTGCRFRDIGSGQPVIL